MIAAAGLVEGSQLTVCLLFLKLFSSVFVAERIADFIAGLFDVGLFNCVSGFFEIRLNSNPS